MKGKGPNGHPINGPVAAMYAGTVLFVAEALARSQLVPSLPIALWDASASGLLAGVIMLRLREWLP